MRTFLASVLVVIVVASCGARSMRGEFERSINVYSDLIRTQKMELAIGFTTDALAEEFAARVRLAKNVRVVDYRISGVKFDEQKGEAEVRAEIDYYTLSAYKLKTLVDVQKWAYLDEGGKKQWKLLSLLPEFK